ncbi:PH domain-containing protein [Dactylosporangium sp. McL0621]|uniref:PH domain-containing protein n=1 Tax=Dactylosporangium sp. McL0621 TaxID=3415678 RepID=UPI003CEEA5E2
MYRARPYVWLGPLFAGVSLLVFGVLAGYPARDRWAILAFEGPVCLLIVLGSVRVRTVATDEGLWLHRTFSRRFVPWRAVEEIDTKRASWAGNELITVAVEGRAVTLPGPTIGVFARRYGRAVLAEVRRLCEQGRGRPVT